jgi:aminoglycoside phosphotransferase (APT) family kinase protein
MTTTAAIPAGPADVTSTWLAAVLGAEIAAVTVSPVGTGQTGATYRATITYADPDAGLPATMIVKLPSQDEAVRERVALGYRAEYAFYTEVADTLTVPLPKWFHCEIDREGADFVLLMADLAPAVQGDQIAGCSPVEARLAVQALAGLHGPRWCDPGWLSFTGATMPRADADFARGMGDLAKMAGETTIGKLGERMSEADRTTLTEAAALVGPWLLLAPERFSLLHGDYRVDNLLFDPERTRVTVVDWQTLTVGLPARDLAYFVATSLAPDVRSVVERELVDAYYEALVAEGVTDYDRETCWQDYVLGMLQVPLLTTFGFAFAAATDRGDDMVLAMLERGCQAIRELGTLDLIRQQA